MGYEHRAGDLSLLYVLLYIFYVNEEMMSNTNNTFAMQFDAKATELMHSDSVGINNQIMIKLPV